MSGIIGVYNKKKENVTPYIHYGLYALQHRGEASCGVVVNNNGYLDFYKDKGLVSEVFTSDILDKYSGYIGIGHVKYIQDHESNNQHNIEPLVVNYKKGAISLSLDGRITNSIVLRDKLKDEGVIFQSDLDAEVVVNLISRYHQEEIEEAIIKAVKDLKGSFSMVIITSDKLIAVRDAYGIRPLSLGKGKDKYLVASETCAFEIADINYLRDLNPGEIIVINDSGIKTIYEESKGKALCLFEHIYLARPDSYLEDTSVYEVRYEAGKELYQECITEADIVIGAPHSGIVSAIGYAAESGIPYAEGLIKNRYIGRTFTEPNQKMREFGVRVKMNALKVNVKNKRVILVDDSIVRGTTLKQTVEILKKAGAKEVHVRISSPPIISPCYLGIDTPDEDKLIAANYSKKAICKMINADSLYYLSLEGLIKVAGKENSYCAGCFTGKYPLEKEDL